MRAQRSQRFRQDREQLLLKDVSELQETLARGKLHMGSGVGSLNRLFGDNSLTQFSPFPKHLRPTLFLSDFATIIRRRRRRRRVLQEPLVTHLQNSRKPGLTGTRSLCIWDFRERRSISDHFGIFNRERDPLCVE